MNTKTKGQDGGNRLTPKTSDSQDFKPEIDLQSWSALGGNTKPSRTDRKQAQALMEAEDWKMSGPGEFPTDKRGVRILDAAALEVLKAWRYFSTVPGDVPAIVAALRVIAWAIKGRLS